MTNAELKQLAKENINNLFNSFTKGQINIAGTVFTLVRKGEYFIRVMGAKGAIYNIGASPKCTIIEDKSLPVFFISKGNKSVDFTFFDGYAIELTNS